MIGGFYSENVLGEVPLGDWITCRRPSCNPSLEHTSVTRKSEVRLQVIERFVRAGSKVGKNTSASSCTTPLVSEVLMRIRAEKRMRLLQEATGAELYVLHLTDASDEGYE